MWRMSYSMPMFRYFDHLETVTSTNEHLKAFVADGVPRITMADEQTTGKGRYGHSWYSEKGKGLYVSFLAYPTWNAARAPFLTMIAALALIRALEAQGGSRLSPKIKSPNDILINQRKVAGILTELSTQSERIRWSIIGIGLNLYQKDFPEELASKATSLLMEGMTTTDPLSLCQDISRHLESGFRLLDEGQWKTVRQEFQTYLQESPLGYAIEELPEGQNGSV